MGEWFGAYLWMVLAMDGLTGEMRSRSLNGASPLMRACEGGCVVPSAETATTGRFLACAAALMGVGEALEAGCDVAHQDLSGHTALHVACARGHTACARILLKAELNPESVHVANGVGWTPLHSACSRDQSACARMLLTLGARQGAVRPPRR